jgi:hypothetical protein
MPCSHCGKAGHNIRTCPSAHCDAIAEQLVCGQAKAAVYAALGPLGASLAVIDAAHSIFKAIEQDGSNKNAKKRQILGGLEAAFG